MVKPFSQGSQRSRRKAGQRRRSRTTRSRRVKRAGSTEETERRILDAAHEVFVRAGTAAAFDHAYNELTRRVHDLAPRLPHASLPVRPSRRLRR
jgi:hypothetical protein